MAMAKRHQTKPWHCLDAPLIGVIGLLAAPWASCPRASRACEFGGIFLCEPRQEGSRFPGYRVDHAREYGNFRHLRPKRPESRSFRARALLRACSCTFLHGAGGGTRLALPQTDVSIC